MGEMQRIKQNIISQLNGLCAHCATGRAGTHTCPVQQISVRIQSLRGVPLIVNDQFRGVLFPRV